MRYENDDVVRTFNSEDHSFVEFSDGSVYCSHQNVNLMEVMLLMAFSPFGGMYPNLN